MMHLYFLLAAVFSTAIGCPIADAQLPTENFLSFVPPDLAPSSNELTDEYSFVPPELGPSSKELTYKIAAESQDSNGQIFQDLTVADQAAIPAGSQDSNGQIFQDFTVADQAAPKIPNAVLDNIESVIDESEKYRRLSCADGWGVCCQGNDPSSANDYLPCSGKSKNVYAGYEEIASQDPRYGQYCYNPVYIHTSQCGNNIFIDLQVRNISLSNPQNSTGETIRQPAADGFLAAQGDNGLTCYTGCPEPIPDGGKISMIGNLQDGLQEIVPDWNW